MGKQGADVVKSRIKGQQLKWRERSGIWTIENEYISITVHGHINEPGEWFVSCPSVGLSRVRLPVAGADQAKEVAVKRVRKEINRIDQLMVGIEAN